MSEVGKHGKNGFVSQCQQTWNILEGIVNDFDDNAWTNLGHGYIVPARLAYHILRSTQYYLEDDPAIVLPSASRSMATGCRWIRPVAFTC